MAGKSKAIVSAFLFLLLFAFAPSASAEIIEIPDCNIYPTHPFCQRPDHDPIVFVPGIATSFNRRVLFKDKPGGVWMFAPFGNIFAGLLTRLQNVGYVKENDLFIAFYDWRHSNTESAAEYLAPIIAEAKEHSESGRVDIVAHSMGGLVAQEYIASDKYTEGEIDQFIMLGTPNTGSSNAYLPWEGGILPSSWGKITTWYINTIEGSLKSVKKLTFDAPISYRQFFPSLKELLPTGPFVTKDDQEVPREDLTEQNPFLSTLLAYRDTLLNNTDITVTTIAGTEKETLDTIAIGDSRTEEDISLGRWRDGHPVEEIPQPNTTAGDQTVLESSALFGDNTYSLPGVSHTALPEGAQDEVLDALGVQDNEPKKFEYEEPKWLTGFVVLSPVDIVITDSAGKTVSKDKNDFGDDAFVDTSQNDSSADMADSDDPKIIILRNLPPDTYTVHLTGTDTGPYTVITTHTTDSESISETLTGNTTPGKEETFTVVIGEDGEAADISEISENSPEPEIIEPTPVPQKSVKEKREKDCCPGKDPAPVVAKKKVVKKGKVLGSTTKGPVTLAELAPLNDVFFSVYGRMPTFEEWKYWAKRYSSDKRDWEQIRGAMWWWKTRGM